MEVLSSATLEAALHLCDKQPGINIGIACSTWKSAVALIESFWDEIRAGRLPGWEMGRGVDGFCEATLRRRIKHEPSNIEIFALNSKEGILGRSFHKVLYESRMSDCLVQELACTERLTLPGEEDDGKELDEFLSSFKIV